ncbi:MAG: PH domain-containing protein [Desulfovibrionaceae bacterium]|nr:PH domain-containing protein [Desulfovibrionaceae bacterium]MBF0514610.1 PH domain-containing protein [Desulfovibrionaceae bacterium]
MDGIAAILSEGETVLYRSRKHWVVFVKAVVLWFLAMAVFSQREYPLQYLHFSVPAEFQKFLALFIEWSVQAVLAALALVFACMSLTRIFSYFTTMLAITPKRLIVYDRLSGALSSYDIGRIESVEARPGFFGPIFGYGAIAVTTGSGRKTVVADLSRPHQFEKELFAAK